MSNKRPFLSFRSFISQSDAEKVYSDLPTFLVLALPYPGFCLGAAETQDLRLRSVVSDLQRMYRSIATDPRCTSLQNLKALCTIAQWNCLFGAVSHAVECRLCPLSHYLHVCSNRPRPVFTVGAWNSDSCTGMMSGRRGEHGERSEHAGGAQLFNSISPPSHSIIEYVHRLGWSREDIPINDPRWERIVSQPRALTPSGQSQQWRFPFAIPC